jgi:hypothetical protein
MFATAAARLLMFLALASPVLAQDTREAQLERQRAEKATRLEVYKPKTLETLVTRAEEGRLRRLIAPHNGFFVEFGYEHRPASSGMGFGGGWRHDLFDRQARAILEAGATVRGYWLLRADFSLPRLAGGLLEVGVEDFYRKQPHDDYFGRGPDTTQDMRVSYLFEGNQFEGRAIVKPRTWLNVGTRFGTLNPIIGPGEDDRYPSIEALFDDTNSPGLLVQPNYVYGEAFAEVDHRDEPGNARAGGYYTLAWRKYADTDLHRYSFQRFDAHARYFIPIFDKKRVFALQTEFVSTTADDGDQVPFYMQPTIGGSHSLRSVKDYRFRDQSVFAFNVEYRWEAFSLLDMALFTDVGTVAPRVSDLDFGNLTAAYGIGFRLNTARHVFYRVDIATGAGEGLHLLFKFSNVF